VTSATAALQDVYAGLSSWIEEHQEGIGEVMAGLMVIAVLQPKLVELRRRWGESEWAYLVERLDFVNGLALMLLLSDSERGETDDTVLDFLEGALAAPEFIAAARAKLVGAPIGAAQRRQLDAGLAFVGKRDYELAVPLLIVALEGAFVSEAERRRLVERAERKLRFTPESGRSGNVGGLEALLDPLGLEGDLDAFLRREVYGGRGNPFRHGTALSGWRRKALSLTVALVACMDLMSETEGTLLAAAFGRGDRGREVVASVVGGVAQATP
jgi:hypothetical protein